MSRLCFFLGVLISAEYPLGTRVKFRPHSEDEGVPTCKSLFFRLSTEDPSLVLSPKKALNLASVFDRVLF